MRIAVVFSSPTPGSNEYENIWKKCPESRELACGQVLIEGEDWRVYVFDGRNSRYRDGFCWNIEAVQGEIADINQLRKNFSAVMLMHGGNHEEVQVLKGFCRIRGISGPLVYTSGKGIFYGKFLTHFAVAATNDCFEKLWDKVKILLRKDEETEDTDLSGELRFLKHKLGNTASNMAGRINMAMVNRDRKLLINFKKADIVSELRRFRAIEPELVRAGISGLDETRSALEDLVVKIQAFFKPRLPFEHLSEMAQDCLQISITLRHIFEKMEREANGR